MAPHLPDEEQPFIEEETGKKGDYTTVTSPKSSKLGTFRRRPILCGLAFMSGFLTLLLLLTTHESVGSLISSAQQCYKTASTSTSITPSPLTNSVSQSAGNPAEESAQTGAIQDVHFLMPATRSSHGFCSALASAVIHDVKPIILEWQAPGDKAAAWLRKITVTLEYMQQYTKDDDLVILADAFDVLVQRPIDDIVREFVAMGVKVLAGVEKNCCCIRETVYKICSGSPESPLPDDLYGPKTDSRMWIRRPRYLNSGTIMGRAKDMIPLYSAMANFSANDTYGKTVHDDQSIVQIYRLKGEHGIALDYWGQLIKPMFAGDQETIVAPSSPYMLPSNDTVSSIQGSGNSNSTAATLLQGASPFLVYDFLTKTVPAMLHYNGSGKKIQKVQEPQLWWTGGAGAKVQEKVNAFLRKSGARLAHPNGEWKSWSYFCDEHISLESSGLVIIDDAKR